MSKGYNYNAVAHQSCKQPSDKLRVLFLVLKYITPDTVARRYTVWCIQALTCGFLQIFYGRFFNCCAYISWNVRIANDRRISIQIMVNCRLVMRELNTNGAPYEDYTLLQR